MADDSVVIFQNFYKLSIMSWIYKCYKHLKRIIIQHEQTVQLPGTIRLLQVRIFF